MTQYTSVPLDELRKSVLHEAGNVQGAGESLAAQSLIMAGLHIAAAETLLRDASA